jgi:hypothetical protein
MALEGALQHADGHVHRRSHVQIHTVQAQVAPGSLVHVHVRCLETLDDGRRKRVSRHRSSILLALIVELVRAVHGSPLVR